RASGKERQRLPPQPGPSARPGRRWRSRNLSVPVTHVPWPPNHRPEGARYSGSKLLRPMPENPVRRLFDHMTGTEGESCLPRRQRLSQNLLHHIPVYIGEPEVAALEFERQAFVIHAQQMEDGGVQIVDLDDVFDGVVAEVVGVAVGDAAL